MYCFFLPDQWVGFLLGLGETACDINTLFQGCETAKGLITLSVNDLLERVQRVLFFCLYECRMKTVFICYELVLLRSLRILLVIYCQIDLQRLNSQTQMIH